MFQVTYRTDTYNYVSFYATFEEALQRKTELMKNLTEGGQEIIISVIVSKEQL